MNQIFFRNPIVLGSRLREIRKWQGDLLPSFALFRHVWKDSAWKHREIRNNGSLTGHRISSQVQSDVQRTVGFHRAFGCNLLSYWNSKAKMPSVVQGFSIQSWYLSCRNSSPRMDLILSCRTVCPPIANFDRMAWGTVIRRALET